jgi:hypothetical protein
MKHEIQINREHKNSPYNCAAVIPEIECEDREEVINLPEVRKLINKTYGKRLVVHVITTIPWKSDWLMYEVEKSKAILV